MLTSQHEILSEIDDTIEQLIKNGKVLKKIETILKNLKSNHPKKAPLKNLQLSLNLSKALAEQSLYLRAGIQ